jgi:transcriptional regulator with XRE-family HTH domain
LLRHLLICYIILIMKDNITKHIRPLRLGELPAEMRVELKEARNKKGWSQRELGRHLGLPQMHVSGIESGKIVPRFDTLLDYVRELDYDLVLVPRPLVPAVLALIRQYEASNKPGGEEERSLYSVSEDEREKKERRSNEI